MNLPNALTVLRILLVPLFVGLLVRDRFGACLGVFLSAGATDALDGYLARRFGLATHLGAILDPIADKVLLLSAFLALRLHPGPPLLPWWFLVSLLLRDFALLAAGLWVIARTARSDFEPSRWGKATTVAQSALVAISLWDRFRGAGGTFFAPLLLIAWTLTMISGAIYLGRARGRLRAARADGSGAVTR